ncbi:MAG: hypothetical protein ABW221_19460 [Vicinamibacteria bacterium]
MRVAIAVVLALSAGSAVAADRWETGTLCDDDTAQGTCNELVHGTLQVGHDLEGPSGTPDRDYAVVQVRARHSYEARVRSNTLLFDGPTCLNGCARLDRVDASGNLLTVGTFPGAPIGNGDAYRGTVVVRWQAAVTEKNYLRTIGFPATGLAAADQYDLELFDTTAFIPRFNNTSSQVTVLLIQNTTAEAVTGDIRFQDATGAIVHTVPLVLAPNGLQVFNTLSTHALSGLSGTVAIAHNGGYGALAGKSVAIEPATGFTFDTPLVSLPH